MASLCRRVIISAARRNFSYSAPRLCKGKRWAVAKCSHRVGPNLRIFLVKSAFGVT